MTTRAAKKAAAPAAAPVTPPTDPDTDTAAPAAPPAAAPASAPLAAPGTDTAAAAEPVAAAQPSTASASPLFAPPPVPGGGDVFLGYVDDAGRPIDPDALFDLSGLTTVVAAKVRANALIRRRGSKTNLMTLAFTVGQELNRADAQAAIAMARKATAAGA